jgi:hypothetical protein
MHTTSGFNHAIHTSPRLFSMFAPRYSLRPFCNPSNPYVDYAGVVDKALDAGVDTAADKGAGVVVDMVDMGPDADGVGMVGVGVDAVVDKVGVDPGGGAWHN